MKKIITTLALTLSTLISVAQTPTPTPTLTVKHYLTTTTFTTTSTTLLDTNIIKAVNGDTISIIGGHTYFCNWQQPNYILAKYNSNNVNHNITETSDTIIFVISNDTLKYRLTCNGYQSRNTMHIDIDTTTATSSAGIKTVNHTVTELSVYPNPVVNYVTVTYNTIERNSVINVYDVAGSLVITMPTSNLSTEANVAIDISTLQSGVYFVRVGSSTQKFIKE